MLLFWELFYLFSLNALKARPIQPKASTRIYMADPSFPLHPYMCSRRRAEGMQAENRTTLQGSECDVGRPGCTTLLGSS